MSLFKAYQDYYESDAKEALFDAIKHYDWVDYQDQLQAALAIKPERRGSSHRIMTSGSTGKRRFYEFGPHWEFWLLALETEVKNKEGFPLLYVSEDYDYFSGCMRPQSRFGVNWHPLNPYGVVYYRLNYTTPSAGFIDLLNIYGPFAIQTSPKCLLGLGRNVEFTTAIERSGSTISSTNYEPFYNTHLAVNDNNITWDSGFAFYTCQFGFRHALPTFCVIEDVCYSLVNINSTNGSTSDLIKLYEVVKCNCGKNRVEFTFIPHVKVQPKIAGRFLYDLGLAKRLVGTYTNMQFIKVIDRLVCAHEGEMVDRELLSAFGVDCFMADSFCCTSNSIDKMAAFFDITQQTDKFIKQRKNK